MDAGADWNDFEAQASALDNTSTQDCATACKALESLARAAQHLCDVAPDQCEAAKARVKSASDRVRAACPSCEERAAVPKGTTFSAQETVAIQAAPVQRGCGCDVASPSNGFGLVPAAAILLAGIRRRWRRRNDLRRVRDALRVEPDAD